VALGGLLVLVAMGGWQVAARASAASTPAVISGCYDAPGSGGRDDRGKSDDRGKGDDSGGALRIVRGASDCKRGETFIQWNQAGVPGPQGVPGPTGPTGPVGPMGALPSVSCPTGQFLTGIAAGVAQCASTSTVSGYALSLMVQGDGTVTSNPPGINCTAAGGTCSATFGAGTTVELFAQPAVGAEFLLWYGSACAGSTLPACSVTMTSTRNLTASFSVAPQAGLFKVTPANPIVFGPGATKTYQITNVGTAASGPISISLSSPNFHIVGVNGCQGVSLAVGASCSFAVTFVLPPEGFPVYFEEAAFAVEAPNAPVLVVAIYAEYQA